MRAGSNLFLFATALLALGISSQVDAAAPRSHPTRLGFPEQCYESLDCTVGASSMVVRATLQASPSGDLCAVVTETIKGKAAIGSGITLGPGYSGSYLPGDDVLLCWHGTSQQHPSRCYALDGSSVVMRMDLQRLTRPGEIVAAARSIAANPRSSGKSISLWANGRILAVPKDERLEQLGRQWASENTVFKRLLAIQALSEFQSQENQKLIESFLDDTRTEKGHRLGKWEVGEYSVRKKAAAVLEGWDLPTPPLPMKGPLLEYQTIGISRVTSAVLAAGCVFAFGALAFRRRMRVSFLSIRLGALALCALGLATLWWRSQSQVDELMFSVGSSHHAIASYSGGVQYQVMHDWEAAKEPVYGSFDRQLCDDVWSMDTQNPTSRRSMLGFAHASGTGIGQGKTTHRFGLVRIPYWALFSLAMAPFALSLRALTRQLRRRRLGLCLHCGYDIRESHAGICSECGHQIPTNIASPSLAGFETRDEMPIGGHAVGV